MKRITRLAAVAALVVGSAAMLAPANAVCTSPRGITSGSSYVIAPGCEASDCGTNSTTLTDNARGMFWAIGEGNPTTGLGIDSGLFPLIPDVGGGWAYIYPGYPVLINSTWGADPRIDGCIDFAVDPTKCMAVLFMDDSPTPGGGGSFALVTDKPDNVGDYDLDKGDINLTTLGKLSITNSVRINGGESVDVSVGGVSLTDIQAGLYLDPDCAQPSGGGIPGVIQGYQVYAREVTRDAPAPTDHNQSAWNAVGPVTPLGSPSTVNLPCSGDTDRYITAGIVFDSAFSNTWLSENALKIQCGVTLADPDAVPQRKVPANRERPTSRERGR